MRFAIKTSPQHTEWQDILDVWKAADQMDFWESGWLFDHFYPDLLRLDGALPRGLDRPRRAGAGHRADAGRRARHRQPVPPPGGAREHGGDGRRRLRAAGSSSASARAGTRRSATAYGIDLPPLKERFDRFDEALEVVVGLLTNTTTDFAGEHYRLQGARCEPKPVQRPHPPICIGGSGEKRTLRARRPLRAALEPPGRLARGHRPQARGAAGPLRRHRARPVGESSCRPTCAPSPASTPSAIADQAAAYEAAGVQLGIVYLPTPHTPAMLEPLAEALEPLRS